jgi:oligosaccharide repeat unit polymerase
MLLLIVTMMFRYGSFDADTFYTASGTMISYGLGHLPAFDMWYVGNEEDWTELTFGGKTFYGITNTLGVLSREQGVFTTMYQVSPHGDETNVFTAFRFFLEDFGTIGSFVYLLAIGSLCRHIYDRFNRKKHIYFSTTLMCAIYFYISWSFATSVFAYASYILMFVYLYVLLRIIFVRTYSACI